MSQVNVKQPKKKEPKFLTRPWYWWIKAPLFTCLYLVAPIITWILLTKNLIVVYDTAEGGSGLDLTIQYMQQPPITDIQVYHMNTNPKCPTGYTELDSFGERAGDLLSGSAYNTFYYRGNEYGCHCDDHILRIFECTAEQLNNGCHTILQKPKTKFRFWKSKLICILQEGPSKINRPQLVGGVCPTNYKVCGNICQLSTAGCPVTDLSLVSQNTGIPFDDENGLYLKIDYGGERPIIHIDMSVGKFQYTGSTQCSLYGPLRGDYCTLGGGPLFARSDSRYRLLHKVNETKLFLDNGINVYLADKNVQYELAFINEILWSNTTIPMADFISNCQFLPSFVQMFIALLIIDIVTCLLTTVINPCLMFSFGRQCELWCVHKLSFHCLLRLRLLEIVIALTSQVWNIVELCLVISIATLATNLRGFLQTSLRIDTDPTTKTIIREVAGTLVDQVSIIGYISLTFSIIMIIWVFINVMINSIEIIGYCIRRKKLKEILEQEKGTDDQEELKDIELKNVSVKGQSFSTNEVVVTTTSQSFSNTNFVQSPMPNHHQSAPNLQNQVSNNQMSSPMYRPTTPTTPRYVSSPMVTQMPVQNQQVMYRPVQYVSNPNINTQTIQQNIPKQ